MPGELGKTIDGHHSFLAHDTGCNKHAGNGIIDIYGGTKWGWRVQVAQS